MNKEFRLIYQDYDGNGWKVYKVSTNIIDIIKACGLFEVMHPRKQCKIEARILSEWEVIKEHE